MSFSVRQLLLVALAATLWAAPADAALCADVNLHFSGPVPAPELVVTLQEEATAIWAPYGVDLRWQSSSCAVEDISFDVLVERHLQHAPADRTVLGTTHVQLTCTDRVPILIDAGATEKVLGALTTDDLMGTLGRPRVGPNDIGRAFGRVLAHEIGHVLLGLPNHQPEGLMRRSFRPADMVGPLRAQYGLSAYEQARLRHRSEVILTQRDAATPDHENADVCYHQRDTGDPVTREARLRGAQTSSHDVGARPGASFRQ